MGKVVIEEITAFFDNKNKYTKILVENLKF